MIDILYKKGDATLPAANGNKIIVHVCNDMGGWGKGFVMAISSRWTEPEKQYRQWFRSKENFALGEVQLVQVEDETWVANMIGQRGVNKDEHGNHPVRYESIASALEKVAVFAQQKKASVHMPRIGCGLAGGKWEKMEPIIIQSLCEKNITVTVYDFG